MLGFSTCLPSSLCLLPSSETCFGLRFVLLWTVDHQPALHSTTIPSFSNLPAALCCRLPLLLNHSVCLFLQMPAELHKQQLLTGELALAGCRFMRLEAAHELAKQLHLLLDDEGYCPSLNLAALPAPHALGLGVPALLRKGLGLDLQNPAIRFPEPSAADSLCNLSWDEYTAVSADQSMCGDWQFCYWVGDATWVPAPFGKFSTSELAAVLTPDAVLASLANGIWGRALITAAQEQGVQMGSSASLSTQQDAAAAAQQQLQRGGALGAAAAGMPDAVKALLEDSMGGRDFRARMRQFSSAVAEVRSNLIGGGSVQPAPGTQNN